MKEKNMFIILSHNISDEQKIDAIQKYETNYFFVLPNNFQTYWSNIIPNNELNIKKLNKITNWLKEKSNINDLVLVQGEFGATFYIVDFCFKNNLIPIYATSERIYSENINADGSIERHHIFKHINFRKYKTWG